MGVVLWPMVPWPVPTGDNKGAWRIRRRGGLLRNGEERTRTRPLPPSSDAALIDFLRIGSYILMPLGNDSSRGDSSQEADLEQLHCNCSARITRNDG